MSSWFQKSLRLPIRVGRITPSYLPRPSWALRKAGSSVSNMNVMRTSSASERRVNATRFHSSTSFRKSPRPLERTKYRIHSENPSASSLVGSCAAGFWVSATCSVAELSDLFSRRPSDFWEIL